MVKWYANYCNSNLWFFKIGNKLFNDNQQWKGSRPEDQNKPDLDCSTSAGGIWATVLGAGVIDAWIKNFGKEQSNIIQDTAQQTANNIVFVWVFWIVFSLLDLILRLPYFLVLHPRITLSIIFRIIIIRKGDVDPMSFVIFWILMPLIVLDWLGWLHWADKYF